MITAKQLLRIIGLLAFIYVFYKWTRIPSLNESDCMVYKEFLSAQFSGKVVGKYIDSEQHAYPMVVLRNESNVEFKFNFVYDRNGIFDSVKVNDVITKNYGSDRMKVSRDGVHYFYKLDYDCK